MHINPETIRERPFLTFTKRWLKECQGAAERVVAKNPPNEEGISPEEAWSAIEVHVAVTKEIKLREVEEELRNLEPKGIVT